MAKLYKLTNRKRMTRNQTLWGKNVTNMATGAGTELCSIDVIHAYRHPIVALLCNGYHAGITNPMLWEAEGDVVSFDNQKVGVKKLTTTKRLRSPTGRQLDLISVGIANEFNCHCYAALEYHSYQKVSRFINRFCKKRNIPIPGAK